MSSSGRPFSNAGGQSGHPWEARSDCRGDPAVVIDRAAAHDLEVLRAQPTFGRRVVEAVGETHAVERILRHAVDDARRGDADRLVDRRHEVIAVVELCARGRVGLDLVAPAHDHRVARPTEVGGQELHSLVRATACPGPARVVLVVGLRRSERVESADLLERRDVHRDRARDPVLRQQLADRAVLTFARGAVVAPDVEDQRVVPVAQTVELVDQAADLNVDVLGVPGGNFHQPALERLLVFGDAFPRRQCLVSRRQLGVSGNPALLLGARVSALAIGVPAVVEIPCVLVGPLLHDVMWAVQAARGPVHVKRLVRLERPVVTQPADGVIRQILAEVVSLVGRFRGSDDRRVPYQMGLVLRCLTRQEAVEVLEAETRRPVLERACRSRLVGGGVMPLAPRAGAVAVVLQNFGCERTAPRDLTRVAVPVVGQLRDLPAADAVVVAAREQRCARRGAHRSGVEPVVRDPLALEAVHRLRRRPRRRACSASPGRRHRSGRRGCSAHPPGAGEESRAAGTRIPASSCPRRSPTVSAGTARRPERAASWSRALLRASTPLRRLPSELMRQSIASQQTRCCACLIR